MRRRHLVALVSAITLAAVVFVAVVAVAVVVNTEVGRDQIRVTLQRQIGAGIRGKLYVGDVSGGLLNGITIDSFAIRGLDDSLLVSVSRVTLEYDPRDLFDRRLLLRNVVLERPVVRLQQYEEGDWNHQRIMRRDGSGGRTVTGRAFGDFVVLDSVTVRDGAFTWVRPWAPNESLTGARRDSAIAAALRDSAREIRRAGDGRFAHVYRWTGAQAFLPHIRLAHPDSNEFGREFVFERTRVVEQEPPFSFRNMRGRVRHLGDSVFLDVAHFDLPGSRGSAAGRVSWGSGLPVRYDIRVRGDTVALKDVAWVYSTLPRVGQGSVDLHIRNNASNLSVIEYALTNLDVRSTRSHLTGSMTFGVGNPVLAVTDVHLRGAPINFDLVRTLAGEPLPVDWQGDLIGTVHGPGGPLTNFIVDSSFITFRDHHVRGAVSRFAGRGGLNILQPAYTEFHGFEVTTSGLDLRSIQYLYPTFVELGGTVSGRATLDSSWLDVRFSNADLSHTNGPGEASRFGGGGRVTWGERYMVYDLTLDAKPLSLVHFSRAYDLGLKGVWSGPISARGRSDSLRVVADLSGPSGRFTYDGLVDAEPLSIAANGQGRVETLELQGLVDNPRVPAGWVTGDYRLDVVGDTNDLATLRGSASADIERSEFTGVRVFPSRIVARFDDRRMFIDTLRVESTAATIDAAGALGLGADRSDTLKFFVAVDSIGGLRHYITPLLAPGDSLAPPDSMSGTIEVSEGTIVGSVRALRIAGSIGGSQVVVRREAGRTISGEFAVTDPFSTPTGTLALRSRRLDVGGIALDSLGFTLRFNEGKSGAFTLGAKAVNSASLTTQGEFLRDDARGMLISLRSALLVVDSGRWHMAGPSNIRSLAGGITLDSLVLLNGRGGRLALGGEVPEHGSARMTFRADSVPLADVSVVAQLAKPLSGWAAVSIAGAGTAQSPVFNAEARLTGVDYNRLRLEAVTARATYGGRRTEVDLALMRGQRTVLTAQGSLPMELRYFGGRLLDDSLRGTVRTSDASLDIAQAVVPGISSAVGRLVANLDLGGSWSHPDVSGSVSVQNGEATIDSLGIRLRGINVDLGLFGHADSLAVRRLVAWNGDGPADSVSLTGHVAYRDLANPVMALRLTSRNFRAIDRRTLARFDISSDPGGVVLRGPLSAAILSGGVRIERGVYFLPDPELARKQTAELRTFFADTSHAETVQQRRRSTLLDRLQLDNVRVTLGDDVSLRSTEADIRLGGALTVQRAAVRVPSLDIGGADTVEFRPVLEGTLRADRGTYNLSVYVGFQREFEVEEGGTIVFYPLVDLPPTLNVSALHTVKRAKQPDLRIRVRLTGPVTSPIVTLESAETYAMSQTDLVSHLLFGVPAFALGAQETNRLDIAIQTFLPSTQAALNAQLGRWLGVVGDGLQVRPGAYDLSASNQGDAWANILYGTRIGRDFQVADNVFLSVSGGLCSFKSSPSTPEGGQLGEFANALSGKLEYRFSPSTSFTVGREPPASVLNCSATNSSSRAFIPTQTQWGVSLFKSWRF